MSVFDNRRIGALQRNVKVKGVRGLSVFSIDMVLISGLFEVEYIVTRDSCRVLQVARPRSLLSYISVCEIVCIARLNFVNFVKRTIDLI